MQNRSHTTEDRTVTEAPDPAENRKHKRLFPRSLGYPSVVRRPQTRLRRDVGRNPSLPSGRIATRQSDPLGGSRARPGLLSEMSGVSLFDAAQ